MSRDQNYLHRMTCLFCITVSNRHVLCNRQIFFCMFISSFEGSCGSLRYGHNNEGDAADRFEPRPGCRSQCQIQCCKGIAKDGQHSRFVVRSLTLLIWYVAYGWRHFKFNFAPFSRTLQSQVKPCLDKLNGDMDVDVKFFASEAMMGKFCCISEVVQWTPLLDPLQSYGGSAPTSFLSFANIFFCFRQDIKKYISVHCCHLFFGDTSTPRA